jgi:DNA-binding PadR family transcriptional regulator
VALKPLVFEVLLALVDTARHGWGLVREVEERLGGEPILPGNFYRTLRRMLADGLIEEAPQPDTSTSTREVRASGTPLAAGAERRRYFRLTADGERVARAEAKRLAALVSDARTRRLLKVR